MTAPHVLDRHRSEARARLVDVLAVGLLLVVAAALFFDMYNFGYSASELAHGASVPGRDGQFVRMIIESFLAAVALCWIAFRLFSASVRRHGG